MQNQESAPRPRVTKLRRRAVWGAIVGVGLIVATQLAAPVWDHQFANMTSFLIALVTLIFVGLQIHRWAKHYGYGNRVPITVMMILLVGAFLFRFDGFSGEMVPQFKFKFGEQQHELRELSNVATDVKPIDPLVEGETSESFTQPQSTGFLGNERTGIVDDREFSVPKSESDLEVMWDQGIGAGWSSFAVASGRAVTLEQRDNMDCVTCYSLATGELLWMQSHEALHQNPMGGIGPRSTPTIDGDRVYAQDAVGLLWCLDLKTGDAHWQVDLLEMAGWNQEQSEAAISWGRSTSPLIVDGLCIVPYGGPDSIAGSGRSLIALDAESGEVRWTAGEDQISYASPGVFTLADQRQIVSVNEKTVTGHLIEDGTVLWEFEWPGQSNSGANCAMAVPAGKDRFIVGKGYGGGSALVKVTRDDEGNFAAEPEWTSSRYLKTKFTHAAVDDGVAYAISNGSLEAIDVETRERLWTQPRRARFGQGQMLVVDDVIVAQAEMGEIVFVELSKQDYEELSRFPALSSKTWNIPTIAGRYLLVRNDRQAICYRLPKR